MKLRPATVEHVRLVNITGIALKQALNYAKRANSPKLAGKIRAAISSWKGARRHVRNRMLRTIQ